MSQNVPTGHLRSSSELHGQLPTSEPSDTSTFPLPALTVEKPTPNGGEVGGPPMLSSQTVLQRGQPTPLPSRQRLPTLKRPPTLRTQSLGAGDNAAQRTSLQLDEQDSGLSELEDRFPAHYTTFETPMAPRKIWVRRPGQAATLVKIQGHDLVDEVKDLILRKFANSLGRNLDSPDITLRVQPREMSQQETARALGPEEEICKALDTYFPGGQSVHEALLIDIPQRRTPRASPRTVHSHHAPYYLDDQGQPVESGTEYFPPMPVTIPSPNPPASSASHDSRHSNSHHPQSLHHERSISVLQTGHVPQLPSPGALGARRQHQHLSRPKYGRQHTSSPTLITTSSSHAAAHAQQSYMAPRQQMRPRINSHNSERPDLSHLPPQPPPLPTPPASEAIPDIQGRTSPALKVSSPGPVARTEGVTRRRKNKKQPADENGTPRNGSFSNNQVSTENPAYMQPSSVPPISVLIVEDNPINLRLLEMFVKRLRVRWQTAMNGREAVQKWRAGGGTGAFHLVLMDLQMPIMSGLEATKEIRRLERLNGIGIFSTTPGARDRPRKSVPNVRGAIEQMNGKIGEEGADTGDDTEETLQGDDVLSNREMFKSPVIIVALTASSLQSDRHEALAAGCNDFLTKPVNFGWLERKVMEWGCMQALIDFDGWRKWMDFASTDSPETVQAVEEPSDGKKKIRARKERRSGNVEGVGSVGVGEVAVVAEEVSAEEKTPG